MQTTTVPGNCLHSCDQDDDGRGLPSSRFGIQLVFRRSRLPSDKFSVLQFYEFGHRCLAKSTVGDSCESGPCEAGLEDILTAMREMPQAASQLNELIEGRNL
ncbi:hypothetical protein FALCPG4_011988 [Fusarium falciforme]